MYTESIKELQQRLDKLSEKPNFKTIHERRQVLRAIADKRVKENIIAILNLNKQQDEKHS